MKGAGSMKKQYPEAARMTFRKHRQPMPCRMVGEERKPRHRAQRVSPFFRSLCPIYPEPWIEVWWCGCFSWKWKNGKLQY